MFTQERNIAAMNNKSGVVLVLEDQALVSLDIEYALREAGFDVTVLRTCGEADAWLEVCRPDIVIVDVILADGPCHDVVGKLVEGNIPFVVHSGDQPSRHEGTPFALGRWISKPSSPQVLVDAALALLPA